MLRSLIKLSRKNLLLPLYHVVSDDSLSHIKNLYSVRNRDQFIKDLDFILKHYQPIDVETLIDSIKNKNEIKKTSVLFTFDDGLKEVYDVIAPILKQKGVPSVFFVNSDFADNKNLFYRYKASLLVEEMESKILNKYQIHEIVTKLPEDPKSKNEISRSILNIDYNNKFLLDEIASILNYDFNDFLKTNQPYLTTIQIESLISQGFSIGAHSVDHPEYFKIPYDEQIRQTRESILWIKTRFKQKHNLFAFPFTDYQVSKEFFDTIYSTESPLIDLSFGCAGIKDESCVNHLQRLPIEKSNHSAKRIITKEYLAYLAKKLIRKNGIRRT